MTVLYREINIQLDSQEVQKDLDELTKCDHDWQMHFNPPPQQMLCDETKSCKKCETFNYTLENTTQHYRKQTVIPI